MEIYTPLIKSGLTELRIKRGKARIDEFYGLEKYCPKCGEFWPQDTEFWFPSKRQPDGLQCWCKGCQNEGKNNSNRKKAL